MILQLLSVSLRSPVEQEKLSDYPSLRRTFQVQTLPDRWLYNKLTVKFASWPIVPMDEVDSNQVHMNPATEEYTSAYL